MCVNSPQVIKLQSFNYLIETKNQKNICILKSKICVKLSVDYGKDLAPLHVLQRSSSGCLRKSNAMETKLIQCTNLLQVFVFWPTFENTMGHKQDEVLKRDKLCFFFFFYSCWKDSNATFLLVGLSFLRHERQRQVSSKTNLEPRRFPGQELLPAGYVDFSFLHFWSLCCHLSNEKVMLLWIIYAIGSNRQEYLKSRWFTLKFQK